MFGVQLYKNNACVLLLRILSILNLDWLKHARSVRGVYENIIILLYSSWNFCRKLSKMWCGAFCSTIQANLHTVESVLLRYHTNPFQGCSYSDIALERVNSKSSMNILAWYDQTILHLMLMCGLLFYPIYWIHSLATFLEFDTQVSEVCCLCIVI